MICVALFVRAGTRIVDSPIPLLTKRATILRIVGGVAVRWCGHFARGRRFKLPTGRDPHATFARLPPTLLEFGTENALAASGGVKWPV